MVLTGFQQHFKEKEMLENFKDDHQLFHTSFQIENFILVKNGRTTYGIYKQALRELISREESLRRIYAQSMKDEINFEELQDKIVKEEELTVEGTQTYELRRLRIDEAERVYARKEIVKVIKDTEREYRHFYNACRILKGRLGDLTVERRKKLEIEFWEEQCKYRLCTDLKYGGRPSGETLGIVSSLANESRKKLENFIQIVSSDQKTLTQFIDTYSQNYDFKEDLDNKLEHDIKYLVENNGTPS